MKLSRLRIVSVSIVGLSFLCSCERKETGALYYNIDSLIQEQVLYLANAHAVVHKQAGIKNISQDTTFAPADSAAWAKELDIFTEIGTINKPINRDGYVVTDGEDDPTSNLTIRTFLSGKELPIGYLKIYYQDTPAKLRKIEAIYRQENSLLASRRKLIMEFTDIYNKNILSSYSIEGEQKMFIGDSVRFSIRGIVQLN